MNWSEFDIAAMRRALQLAERALYTTDPNPRVGCVIARGSEIVGEGWHERAGEPHAEVFALRAAGERAQGATAYVTLEPCNHHGRTPPCVDALLAARVARVVFAIRDPNPRVNGTGAARLEAAGVRVEVGLLEAEAAQLNAGFLQRMRSGRPFVRLKTGASLDGRVALADGASRWITSDAARADVQHWRARSSAILTGAGTIAADDPALTVRLPNAERQPLRVVLQTELALDISRRVFAPPGKVLVIGAQHAEAAAQRLRAHGVEVELVPQHVGGLDLVAVLQVLARRQANEVLVEAGPTLSGALLSQGLVDEWLLYIAPKLLGASARPLAAIASPTELAYALRFENVETLKVGDDVRMRLVPRRG
jgi:diaminohydroxyphosphoribosylaminopyrimidine deaminase/5-amino-6-(5-phosphoribosylamino)uracil reductase